jgi:ParB-like chromosome segregation protein Spo0J
MASKKTTKKKAKKAGKKAASKKTSSKRSGNESRRWPADEVERRPVEQLIPYARNARLHSDSQVAQIAASIREWGWTVPVLVDEQGTIIAGHGRVLAAQKLGIEQIPTMTAQGWTEEQKRAYVLADNKLTLNGEWDDDLLATELSELKDSGFQTLLTGFDDDEISDLLLSDEERRKLDQQKYTAKIETPIYEPKGEEPKVAEIYDAEKAQKLIEDIEAADLPKPVAEFLRFAAHRHVKFDYGLIAEFYCHQGPELQKLMRDSALVIIDAGAAIEQGYVTMHDELLQLVAGESGDLEDELD